MALEGEWKEFVFRVLGSEDLSLVQQHVRQHFLKSEPLNLILGWSDENGNDHDKLVDCILSHGLSIGAFHKETQQLVALNLIIDALNPGQMAEFEPNSDKFKKISGILGKSAEVAAAAFAEQFDAEKQSEIFITSIDSGFEGKDGIEAELYRRTLEWLKEKGFKSVRCGETCPEFHSMVQELGFTILGKVYFNQYEDDNGQKPFAAAVDNQCIFEVAKAL